MICKNFENNYCLKYYWLGKIKSNKVCMLCKQNNGLNNPKINICKHAKIISELYLIKTPCKGRKVICKHPDNNGMIWYENGCNSQKCKFFTSEEE